MMPCGTMHCSIWAIAVLCCTLPCRGSILIDNFRHSGSLNSLGLERKWYGGVYKHGRMEMKKNSSLYETITGARDSINLIGKSIRITYSIRSRDRNRLSLRLKNERTRIRKHVVSLQLTIGKRRQVDVPVSAFSGANPRLAYGLGIYGPMTIHRIEIVNVDESVLVLPATLPRLQIDTFKSASVRREIGPTAELGVGYLSLVQPTDYVREVFADHPINLQYMAVRIIYSSYARVKCVVGIESSGRSYKGEFQFMAGMAKTALVRIRDLFPDRPLTGDALTIQAGMLVLHEIDLVMDDRRPELDMVAYFQNSLQLLRVPTKKYVVVRQAQILHDAVFELSAPNVFRMDVQVFILHVHCTDSKHSLHLFFKLLQAQFSDPDNLIFEPLKSDKRLPRFTNQWTGDRLFGQMIGMMILNKAMLTMKLTSTVYKCLLDLPIDDLHEIVPRKLLVALKNPNTPINQSPKESQDPAWHVNRLIGAQTRAIQSGFYEVIPKVLVNGLSVDEFVYIVSCGCCGSQDDYLTQLSL